MWSNPGCATNMGHWGVALLAPLLLVASLGRAGSVEDVYTKLLSAVAKNYGKVDKTGVLPVTKWNKDDVSLEAFNEWLMNSSVLHQPVSKIPPLSFRCALYANHAYKFIFIRNRKAASTSIVEALGGPCYAKRTSRPACLDYLEKAQFLEHGTNAEKGWKEYFVFAVARNPWARAASGFDYLTETKRANKGDVKPAQQRKRPAAEPYYEQKGVCRLPSFEEFCRDPMVLGKQHMLFKCSQQNAAYNFFHVEPAARCMLDDSGASAVDFIIRYENLAEDFQEAVKIINQRRSKNLPAIRPAELDWKKKGIAAEDSRKQTDTETSEQHAAKYRRCGGACVQLIQEFYAEDMRFFGFSNQSMGQQ